MMVQGKRKEYYDFLSRQRRTADFYIGVEKKYFSSMEYLNY